MGDVSAPCRGLRRDAERNRQRILQAAAELISAHGVGVSMDEIAARAGVGIGTMYRRFPTKQALVEQLTQDVRVQLLAAADRALAREDGEGLEEFLRASGHCFARQRGVVSVLGRDAPPSPSAAIAAALAELLRRATEHGRIAPDTTVADLLTLLRALHALIEIEQDISAMAWERHLDIHLAGLAPCHDGAPRSSG